MKFREAKPELLTDNPFKLIGTDWMLITAGAPPSFKRKDIPESDLEEVCDTSWLGNISSELVRGVEKLGFEAEEIENVTLDYIVAALRDGVPLIALLDPAVLYGGLEGFGHFVVITGLEGDKIVYNDPDMDKDLQRDTTEFFKAWEKFSFQGVRIWKSTKK